MTDAQQPDCPRSKCSRRAMLIGCSGAAALAIGGPLAHRALARREPVFLAGNQRYDGPLEQTIEEGLAAVGFDLKRVRDRTVLLKPNLVEPTRDCPHMTTHPAMIVAAAEVFRRHGARVIVGEAPGHVRDTDMALAESGVGEALHDARLPFADLNYEDVVGVPNAGKQSRLAHLYLPRSAVNADLIVSLPKLKTHHWMGATASMKNLYGLLPGIKYGWPKNVLHHAGIPETVVDIQSTVASRVPTLLGIVDAIDCMEGDGPIMGSLKRLGMVAVGANLPALDATCARIMGLEPTRIGYLKLAQRKLGPLADWQIMQRGEGWQNLRSPFKVLDFPHLKNLRDSPEGPLVS